MPRILVEAELEVTGAASIANLVASLNQADFAAGHPHIEQVKFALVDPTSDVRIDLVINGDSYRQAESIAEKFLNSVDEYIKREGHREANQPLGVHEGPMLLMPA